MIRPWLEVKVDDCDFLDFLESCMKKGYVLELQNPVLHSNSLYGSVFIGKTDILSPEIFSELVTDSVPNISCLRKAHTAMMGVGASKDKVDTAYYDVIRERVFEDFPYFEIGCCDNVSTLFPFTSTSMIMEYIDKCGYFDFNRVTEEPRVNIFWYHKKGKKRYAYLGTPENSLPKDSIYFRYRVWENPKEFCKFAKTMGSSSWLDKSGRDYTMASLLESKSFYDSRIENL